jgi:hypothetical protein
MISPETRARWREKLSVIKKSVVSGEYTLSNWEQDFAASIECRLSDGVDITMQQSIALDSLYRKVTECAS